MHFVKRTVYIEHNSAYMSGCSNLSCLFAFDQAYLSESGKTRVSMMFSSAASVRVKLTRLIIKVGSILNIACDNTVRYIFLGLLS